MRCRELDERANQWAHALCRAGVRRGDRVGVCLQRGPELIVTLLAVLKAGACYVPLDPAYPQPRLHYMLSDSRAGLVLTQRQVATRLGAPDVPALCVDSDLSVPAAPSTRPLVDVGPTDLAYVIYTSGSTGRPKGVAIEHGATALLLRWVRETFDPSELAGVLAATSICFDLSIFEIFGPLAWGGHFVLVRDVLELPSLPADCDVRLVNTVPSAMSELLAAGGVPDTVRTVCLAGERLTAALARRVWQLPRLRRLLNLYGPSEDTTYSTWAEVPPGDAGPPPIGRPLPGTATYVLDEWNHPVSAGVAGELYLGSASLARGYLDRPAETAARFLPDPFASSPGRRMYRTGDRVRLRPDGQLEFLGRVDDQVKIRGYRIELGEVAAGLVGCPGVRDAAATVVPGPTGDPRLVGYLVSIDNSAHGDDVLAVLRNRLPRHLIPAELVWLDALPRTPNGKVDRSALPPPNWSRPADQAPELSPPTEEVDRAVRDAWVAVLGPDSVRGSANFFELGGDSLLATQVVTRLRAATGAALSLSAVFDHPTVEQLAAAVRAAPAANPPAHHGLAHREPPYRELVAPAAPRPASFSQRQLWFLHALNPTDMSYVLRFVVWLRGPVDPDVLQRALRDVADRHPALRTAFHLHGDVITARVHPLADPVGLQHSYLQAAGYLEAAGRDDGATLEARLRRLATLDSARPFDLEQAPLARYRLVHSGRDVVALILTVHHIVFDAWSFAVFVHDLGRCYDTRFHGNIPEPGNLVDPATWAGQQQDWLTSPAGKAKLDSLATALRDASTVLELPTDRPRLATRDPAGGLLRRRVDDHVVAGLAHLAGQRRVSRYMIGLAAFAGLLHSWTGHRDLVIGTAFAGRVDPDVADVIGCFANTVPIRLALNAQQTFDELLSQVRNAALFAAEHQDVPFDCLVDRLRPPRTLAHNPLVQTAFGVHNAQRAQYRGNSVSFDGVEIESDGSRLDLTLWLEERDGRTDALWTYAADLFDEITIVGLHHRYVALLQAATAAPERTLAHLATELTRPKPRDPAPVTHHRMRSATDG